MNTKIIVVERLPGSGKSTTAQLIFDILTEMNIDAQLFLEGNLDHPADYEGVACFTKSQFDALLSSCSEEFREPLNKRAIDHYLLPYRKIQNELGLKIPDELSRAISNNDIYELPMNQNFKLIADKWKHLPKLL